MAAEPDPGASQPVAATTDLTPFTTTFVARKAMFSFLGSAFRIFGPGGELRFYVKQKAFKLKEEITVFADESRSRPMLRINARRVLDHSATYDVVDARSGERAGAVRREGFKSILRDEWTLLGDGDEPIGKVREDTGLLAFVRRFLSNLVPQSFEITVGEERVGSIAQRFNPFILTYDVDFSADRESRLDPRMGVALTVLLLAIEGRQD